MKNTFFFGILSLVVAGFLLFNLYLNTSPTVNKQEAKINSNGNVRVNETVTVNFFLDIYNPKDGATVNNSIINISGKSLGGAEVFVNEKETEADQKGVFSLDYELFEGKNDLYISANDEKGNYIEKMITVYLETKE